MFRSYTLYKIGWGMEATLLEAWYGEGSKDTAYKRLSELKEIPSLIKYYIVEGK